MKSRMVLLSVLLSSTAQAGNFYDGNKLLNLPSAGRLGYVAAVNDSAWAITLVSNGKYTFCAPQAATLGQTTDVVLKWLRENPAERHRDADLLVMTALNATWPCPATTGEKR